MNVTVETLAPCKKLIRVDYPVEEVGESFDKVTREFQKYANLPGFRPGKAPKHLVIRSFKERIEQEVKRELVGSGYRDAIKDNDLHVVGEPDFEEIQFSKDTPFQFAVTVETAPEFELPEYKGLKVTRQTKEVTDADIEQAINVLREKRATFEDVDREIQDDDLAVVNYEGTCDEKPITETAPSAARLEKAEGFWLKIASDQFIPGFTDQLKGAKAGDKRQVSVDFPADFAVTELAGKTGQFDVEVTQVKIQNLPDLDDEFSKQYGADDVDALRQGVANDLEAELKSNINRDLRNQLIDRLMSQVTCDLPESVVEQETKNVVYNIVRENRNRGVAKEVIDEKKDEIYNMAASSAQDRIKSAFIMGRIAAEEKITATNEEINYRIIELAQMYEIKPEKMAKQLKERDGISEIQEQIITAKVLDFLELHAEIEDALPTE